MLKRELLNYINKEGGHRSGASIILAEMLGVSAAAVSQWGTRIPIAHADTLNKLFCDDEFRNKYNLIGKGWPIFSEDEYAKDKNAALDSKAKIANDKRLSDAATRVLDKAEAVKSDDRRIGVLTRFIKGLI